MRKNISLLFALLLSAYIVLTPSVYASTVEQYKLRQCYAAGTAAFSSVASATDIAYIYGNATSTVKITRVEISGVATTGANVRFFLIKRSAAESAGGTAVAATSVPLDSTYLAAGSTLNANTTTNITTVGTAVGNVAVKNVYIPAAADVVNHQPLVLFDEHIYGQPVVLRGIAQGLAIGLGGVTVTGGSFNVNVYWTEEQN